MSYAWAARGEYGRLAAGILSLIALLISCLAAIGAASSGKQEASDPKAKAIERYDSAERTRTKAEARLEELGKLPTADEAAAKASSLLAKVDASIAKRTQGCTVLAPASNGPRQVEANRVACQPWIDASALISKAQEAADLRAKLDVAEEVIAEGKPASAGAQASTIAWFFGLFMKLNGIDSIQAMTNLFLGLGLEISSPLAWAAFASARRGHASPMSISPISREVEKIDIQSDGPSVAEEDPEARFAALKAATLSVAETHPLVAMFSGELPEPTPPKPGKRKKPVPSPANVVDFRQHPVVRAQKSTAVQFPAIENLPT